MHQNRPERLTTSAYNEAIQRQHAISSLAYALVMLPNANLKNSCYDELTAHEIFEAINGIRMTRKSAPGNASDHCVKFSLDALLDSFNDCDIRKIVQKQLYPDSIEFVRRAVGREKKIWKVKIDPDWVKTFQTSGNAVLLLVSRVFLISNLFSHNF